MSFNNTHHRLITRVTEISAGAAASEDPASPLVLEWSRMPRTAVKIWVSHALDLVISPDLQSCSTSHFTTNHHATPPSGLQSPGTLPRLKLWILAQHWHQLGLCILQVTEDGLNSKGNSLAYEIEKDFRARWIQWLNMVFSTQVLSICIPCLPQ